MDKVIILFQHNDEYGHWDIMGVFSSVENLEKGWKNLQEESRKQYVKVHGENKDSDYLPWICFETLANWDDVLKTTKEKYGDFVCIGGNGYYWKWVELDTTNL